MVSAVSNRPIVICAPSFRDDSGGTIVLHHLCSRLRALGEDAYLYPTTHFKKVGSGIGPVFGPLTALRRYWLRTARPYRTHPSMDVPIADRAALNGAVIVYPEVTEGNPTGSDRVVRWLLHRPGHFHGPDTVSDKELVFHYQPGFAPEAHRQPDRLLRIRWYRTDVYRNQNHPDRKGACRMIRKGKDTRNADLPGLAEARLVDGLSHEAMAEAFNRSEIFFCHDHYTMYYYYAALCGCVPVVVPRPGVSAEDWRASMAAKKGVAYGTEEIDWARESRDGLLEIYAEENRQEERMIRSFVATVREHYG